MEESIAILKRALESVKGETARIATHIKQMKSDIAALENEYHIFDLRAKEIQKALEKLEGKNEQAPIKTKKAKR